MNDLQVCLWPIDKPIPYARNARKISDKAVDKVAASIKEFGFRQPIVVDRDNVIIVGHARLLAAKKLGLSQVPVHVAENLTPAQVKSYRLMDNRSHEEADWDLELLGPEISELKDLGVDLSLTGFDTSEIDRLLLSSDDDEKANATPPLPEVAVTRLGDLWHCGPHRVICGDATQQSTISRLCAQTVPFLMVTDPPYGVEYEPEWREESGLNPKTVQAGKVSNDDRVDWSPAWALFPGDVVYVWHAGIYAGEVAASLFGTQLPDPWSDHLAQAALRHQPRRIPLATRTVLVRSAEGKDGSLEGRSHSDDGLGCCELESDRRQPGGGEDRPRHPEARRADAATDSKPHRAGRCCL